MQPYDFNKYYFLQLPEPALNAILEYCVEKTIDKARKLYDDSYVIKLPMNDPIPSVLQNKTAYIHSEVLIEIAKREAGRPI